jgi:hypothetical protein
VATAYLQVPLTVQPKGGSAELVPPKAVQSLNYHFVTVKDGGTEAIIRLEEPPAVVKEVEQNEDCKKLTAKQVEAVRKSYPSPKLKQQYRVMQRVEMADQDDARDVQPTADEEPIVDTIQTVRAGFYLIDVPVVAESDES